VFLRVLRTENKVVLRTEVGPNNLQIHYVTSTITLPKREPGTAKLTTTGNGSGWRRPLHVDKREIRQSGVLNLLTTRPLKK
jgi:hypothetical protein